MERRREGVLVHITGRERVSDAVLKCYELLILSLVDRVKRELYLYAEILYRNTMSYWTKDIGRKWPLDMKQLLC